MNKWLQAFAYRISISWWMFAMAGLLAILIALLTVSFHAIRAAIVNPVKVFDPNSSAYSPRSKTIS